MKRFIANGLSHKELSINSFPSSILLAISISFSRDSNSTPPISRKYRRTGSSVEPKSSSSLSSSGSAILLKTVSSSLTLISSFMSSSSSSIISIPASENLEIAFSSSSTESFLLAGIDLFSSS